MSILNNIGNTPLVEIKKIWKSEDVRIFAKVEGMNPGGSIKDRIAKAMILDAIKKKQLKPDMEIIEATSGNTAIGIAMVCAALGRRCTLVMPNSVSKERAQICRAYGANLIKIKGNMDRAIAYVEEMLETYRERGKGHLLYNLNQFDNPMNWRTHFHNTAPEICEQLMKQLYWTGYYSPNPTHFVAACGTTGTIVGCSKKFRDYYLRIKSSPYPEEIRTYVHAVFPKKDSKIQGLKNLQFSRMPKIYAPRLIHGYSYANDAEAFAMTKRLAREEGLFCGISSGAAMAEAVKLAKTVKSGSFIVVILPDNGYRYLSEKVF
jgi:cysteinyl-tRNA synthetase